MIQFNKTVFIYLLDLESTAHQCSHAANLTQRLLTVDISTPRQVPQHTRYHLKTNRQNIQQTKDKQIFQNWFVERDRVYLLIPTNTFNKTRNENYSKPQKVRRLLVPVVAATKEPAGRHQLRGRLVLNKSPSRLIGPGES